MRCFFALECLLASSGLILACVEPATQQAVQPAATETDRLRKPALPSMLPDEPAAHELAWLLDVINNHVGRANLFEILKHFDGKYLTQMSPWATQKSLLRIAQSHAVVSIERVEPSVPHQLVAFGKASYFPIRMWIKVDGETGRIRGFALKPDLEEYSMDAILDMIPSLAPRAQLLVGRLKEDTCTSLYGVNEAEPLAIASTYKLYLLLALAEEISTGRWSWDTSMAIREDWKSYSHGNLKLAPEGTLVTLHELASKMISESDNTAADHIFYALGRRAVESALQAARHQNPALNVPFLSSREMFDFRRLSAEQVDRYLALDEGQRRYFLEHDLATVATASVSAESGAEVLHIGKIGWFASSLDLCNLMGRLTAHASKHHEGKAVLELLAASHSNQQGGVSEQTWPYVGRKSGDLPGIRSMTWLLTRHDGQSFVVTHTFNDPYGLEPDKSMVFALSWKVIGLLSTAGVDSARP